MGLSASIIGVYVGLRGEIGFSHSELDAHNPAQVHGWTGLIWSLSELSNFVIFSQVEGTIYVSTTFSHLLPFAKVSANISFPLGLRLKICNYQILEIRQAFYYSVEPSGIVI